MWGRGPRRLKTFLLRIRVCFECIYAMMPEYYLLTYLAHKYGRHRGAVRVVCEQGVPNIWRMFFIRILICFACVCRRTSRAVNCVFLMTALSHHTAGLAGCYWLTVRTVDNVDNAGKLISPRPLSAALMLTLTGRDATFHDVSWWSKFHQKFHQKFQRTFR